MANFSDAHAAGRVSSLYGNEKPAKNRFEHLKVSSSGHRRQIDRNWKADRRQSEQTRVNEMTGETELIDVLKEKKDEYLALKKKYAGKDSSMRKLLRREAENIQRQRARITELKDFKAVM